MTSLAAPYMEEQPRSDHQTTVALYCRQSKTRGDESASNAEQERELRVLAERRGWTVHQVYADADAPADAIRRRKAWARLLADASAGKFTSWCATTQRACGATSNTSSRRPASSMRPAWKPSPHDPST